MHRLILHPPPRCNKASARITALFRAFQLSLAFYSKDEYKEDTRVAMGPRRPRIGGVGEGAQFDRVSAHP